MKLEIDIPSIIYNDAKENRNYISLTKLEIAWKAIADGKPIDQEPILDKVKQAREEIENEVKFWSEPSKYNVESVVNARKAKAQSYKHCLEILDTLIESEE